MPTANTAFNSGRYADIRDSIIHSRGNIVLLPHTATRINYNNMFICEEPLYLAKARKTLLTSALFSIKIDASNQFSPEFISEKHYGTPDLWYIIMMVNGFNYPTQIKPPSIKMAPRSAVVRFLSEIQKNAEAYKKSRENPVNIEKRFVTELGV